MVLSYLLSICYFTLFPSLSNSLFKALSVHTIEQNNNIICNKTIIVSTIDTNSKSLLITNNIIKRVTGNDIKPNLTQISPQYWWANLQVSIFFIDLEVLYPQIPLIFLGLFLLKYIPTTSKINGINKETIK